MFKKEILLSIFMDLFKVLVGRKVIMSLVFFFLVVLFTYALYSSDGAINTTSYVIRKLAGG
jgi:hypothetical protein